jgi:hypothetical protein
MLGRMGDRWYWPSTVCPTLVHFRSVILRIDIHLFPNTPEGHGVLHQLQTRAEAWAEGVS